MGAISINRYSSWHREYKVGPKLHFLKKIFPHSLNPGNQFPTSVKWFYLPKDRQPSGDATQQHIKHCLQENTKLGWCWKPKPMLQTRCEGVYTTIDYKLLTILSLWPNPSYTRRVKPFAVLQKYLPAHHRQLNKQRWAVQNHFFFPFFLFLLLHLLLQNNWANLIQRSLKLLHPSLLWEEHMTSCITSWKCACH
jgi:hypothetical protein